MPKERFFHLTDSKKQRITQAIFAEFSRVPFDQISINKIVQTADIPRGSFYQYFEDKMDLLCFILQDFRKEMDQILRDELKRTKGDLFAVCQAALTFTVTYGTQKEHLALFQNVFPHLKLQDEQKVFPYLQVQNFESLELCCKEQPESSDLLQLLRNYFSGVSQRDLLDLIEISLALLHYTIAQTFFHLEQKDEIQANFKNKLSILKRGLLREESCNV